ncbi:MAG: transposase [Planctomycetota bacterium]
MGQSLVQLYIHAVWSTKHRQPFLRLVERRKRLFAYMTGICTNHHSPAILIGGTEDHCHLLIRLDKTIELSRLICEVKKEASRWAKTELLLSNFYWQAGYGAFSISPSHVERLKVYIANQEEHHRKVTFQDEFRILCKKYHLKIDERYAWE